MASGEIVGWLNADDQREASTVAHVARAFADQPEIDVVWRFYSVVDPEEGPQYGIGPSLRQTLAELRKRRNFVPRPGRFFRRALIDRFGALNA
jgi:hypothetical protein